ncbi:hypothetical protein QQF64_009992 [Cirrhinus molitorella]|uniref:EF-hand domain-containing protein n=1 Tax=Cirrhinus molitorella TaxID=172907 RepID=A0ABR3M2Q5_9TELE
MYSLLFGMCTAYKTHPTLHSSFGRSPGINSLLLDQLLRGTFSTFFHLQVTLCLSTAVTMPSDLERAMETLITVFHRYASKEIGNASTLNRRELKMLMETELASFLKTQKDPAAVDKIMKDLDSNGDGEVNFEEFVSLVVGLSIACEQLYQKHKQAQAGGDMASKLEKAIVAIVEVFEEYAGTDEQKKQLSNAELLQLIKAQITSAEFKDKVDPDKIKEVMEELDKNHDGEVNFREFSQCIAGLARAYFVKKHGKEKCKGKGKGCQDK